MRITSIETYAEIREWRMNQRYKFRMSNVTVKKKKQTFKEFAYLIQSYKDKS